MIYIYIYIYISLLRVQDGDGVSHAVSTPQVDDSTPPFINVFPFASILGRRVACGVYAASRWHVSSSSYDLQEGGVSHAVSTPQVDDYSNGSRSLPEQAMMKTEPLVYIYIYIYIYYIYYIYIYTYAHAHVGAARSRREERKWYIYIIYIYIYIIYVYIYYIYIYYIYIQPYI
jgi:hypothetical protein